MIFLTKDLDIQIHKKFCFYKINFIQIRMYFQMYYMRKTIYKA